VIVSPGPNIGGRVPPVILSNSDRRPSSAAKVTHRAKKEKTLHKTVDRQTDGETDVHTYRLAYTQAYAN